MIIIVNHDIKLLLSTDDNTNAVFTKKKKNAKIKGFQQTNIQLKLHA